MKMQLTIHFLWQQFSKIRTDPYIILQVSRFITRQRYFSQCFIIFRSNGKDDLNIDMIFDNDD